MVGNLDCSRGNIGLLYFSGDRGQAVLKEVTDERL